MTLESLTGIPLGTGSIHSYASEKRYQVPNGNKYSRDWTSRNYLLCWKLYIGFCTEPQSFWLWVFTSGPLFCIWSQCRGLLVGDSLQLDTLFVHCTFKSTEKANRKRPTFQDTGYLVSVSENEALGSKFHQKSNIPNTSLRNGQRWQLSSTVSCQGSKTSISSG